MRLRRGAGGARMSVALRDHVDVVYELANGAQVHMRFSETTGLSQGNQTWIHGSEGTLYVDARQAVFGGKRGDTELTEIPNPPADRATARVELEFVNAIRGLEPVTPTGSMSACTTWRGPRPCTAAPRQGGPSTCHCRTSRPHEVDVHGAADVVGDTAWQNPEVPPAGGRRARL